MNIEDVRAYCLSRPHAAESFPFDEDTLVFKAGNAAEAKMFAAVSLSKPDYLLLKCDPDRAVELRERHHPHIEPGYHCNKRHWNGLWLNGRLDDSLVRELIDHSHALVVASLKRSTRLELGI